MKDIAAILYLSEKTVEFHRGHVMEVSYITSNAELVLFGLKRGLIALITNHLPLGLVDLGGRFMLSRCPDPRDFPNGKAPRIGLE